METTNLVIIDPQNDFCDPKGTLYVPGAEDDMQRLADFLNGSRGDLIKHISVTLDSHHYVDIAHAPFWVDSAGKNPDPMTIITHDQVMAGDWRPKIPSMLKYVQEYTEKLAANNRYPLMIWPTHCVVGTWGTQIHPVLEEALAAWSIKHTRNIDYVAKGNNPLTEHYSAVKADVPDPRDPTTNLNVNFITRHESADNVLVAGEASSHCVLYTVQDMVDEFGDANIAKLIMLTDAMSPVQAPGIDFPQIAKDFQESMKARGLRTATTTDWMNSKTLGAK